MRSSAKCIGIAAVVFVVHFVIAENNTKLKDVLKNSYNRSGNRTDGNSNNNGEDDDFKSEIMKALDQCSSAGSGNDDRNSNNYRNNGNKRDQGRDFYKYMGNGDNGRGSNDNEYGYSGGNNYRNRGSTYGSNQDDNSEVYSSSNNNYNEYRKHSGRGSNNQNSNSDSSYSGSSYGGYNNNNNDKSNRNCDNPYQSNSGYDYLSGGYNINSQRNGNGRPCHQSEGSTGSSYGDSNNNNNNNNNRDYNPYQQTGYDRNGDYSSGYAYNRDNFRYTRRKKRNSKNRGDNENECISQCVFGYMELLDDDKLPSESLVIKWVQDHIENDNMKRIKTLREIRKCFARLSTSDLEDGCEFSKELSKCLNLELE